MTKNKVIKSKEGLVLGKTKEDGIEAVQALSTSDATLQISSHMAAMMFFLFGESEATPEEEEEFDDVTLNFASLLCASMNLDVKSINSNGEITLTAKLEDINKFLREMLSD
jgi:hypothetical protein